MTDSIYSLKNDPYLFSVSNSTIYTQQETLNINGNINYRKSANSVKLLPTISNNNGKIKFYTEVNSNIKVGDKVFIMYDNHQNKEKAIIEYYNPGIYLIKTDIPTNSNLFLYVNKILTIAYVIENKTITITPPTPITDIVEFYYELVADIIIDSYLEFSGCTNMSYPINNWQYLSQSQGYVVLEVNETNNEITINRFYDSRLENKKIYNHYIGKIYARNIEISRGEIDGSMINNITLNINETLNMDINLVQSIILSGVSNYVNIKNKYDTNYISTNSNLSDTQTTSVYKPYIYKGNIISNLDKNPVSSYYSKNNNKYGYDYIYNTQILSNNIRSGYYKNCIIDTSNIYGGEFINCQIYSGVVYYGNFIDCKIINSIWLDGIWEDTTNDVNSFLPNGDWVNGVWNMGVFSGRNWINGVFNNGTFIDSNWYDGFFQGGKISSSSSIDLKTWYNGTFSGGFIINMIWKNGTFNGGDMNNCRWDDGIFNGGTVSNTRWINGIFNNGSMNYCQWTYGIVNNGNILKTKWIDGIFNGGTFSNSNNVNFGTDTDGYYDSGGTYSYSYQEYYWIYGIFNGGNFLDSVWEDGTFNNGTFGEGSFWKNGIFMNGNFNNSYWLTGLFGNGVVNDSSFHSVVWKRGIWNSGNMGIRNPLSRNDYPIVDWYNGTFNVGIFGHILYKWKNDHENVLSAVSDPYIDCLTQDIGLTGATMNWHRGDFYGKYFFNYFADGCNTNVGGFSGGTFHNGYFCGTFWGGIWLNGDYYSGSCNKANVKTPKTQIINSHMIKKLGRKFGNQSKNGNYTTREQS